MASVLKRMIRGRTYDLTHRTKLAKFVHTGAIFPEFAKMTREAQMALAFQVQEEGYETVAELLFDCWLEHTLNKAPEVVPQMFMRSKNL